MHRDYYYILVFLLMYCPVPTMPSGMLPVGMLEPGRPTPDSQLYVATEFQSKWCVASFVIQASHYTSCSTAE